MFRIRKAQMEALAKVDLRRFRRRATAHLRAELPDAWAGRPDGEVLAFVDDGIGRAAAQEIHEETSVLHYLELMTLLGADFGRSPRYEGLMPLLDEDDGGVDWLETRAIFLGITEEEDPEGDDEETL
ncbi:MAG TPA: hypothetical protein VE093_26520 [Polyangiaceae bacterium]|nr:hypothetical protein [Polyangiaceae bacterium]